MSGFQIPFRFPSEVEALRKDLQGLQHLTMEQRLLLVDDTLSAAEALSKSGAVREAQLEYHRKQEAEWRRRMTEFIKKHDPA